MMDEPIVLVRVDEGYGATGADQDNECSEVFCEVAILGTKTKMNALSAGIKMEASMIVWTDELEDFTHADWKGKRYKIENSIVIDALKTKIYLGTKNV